MRKYLRREPKGTATLQQPATLNSRAVAAWLFPYTPVYSCILFRRSSSRGECTIGRLVFFRIFSKLACYNWYSKDGNKRGTHRGTFAVPPIGLPVYLHHLYSWRLRLNTSTSPFRINININITSLVPSTQRTKTHGDRAFPVATVRVWNTRPASTWTASTNLAFWLALKTLLFKAYFRDEPTWHLLNN